MACNPKRNRFFRVGGRGGDVGWPSEEGQIEHYKPSYADSDMTGNCGAAERTDKAAENL